MALVRPFRALRPSPEAAPAVASVPYDVVTTEEARALAAGHPLSFLHVTRAEIDLPQGQAPYAAEVYAAAVEHFRALRAEAPLVLEELPSLYFYRLTTGSHTQTGLAGCYSLEEYDTGRIKKHERTTPDKEDDRTRHMLALEAQTGIVFLTYRAAADVDAIAARVSTGEPLFHFDAPDGVRHTLWRLPAADCDAVVEAFGRIPTLYIADGHHRAASAARVRRELAAAGRRGTEHETFLGVAFPDRQTRILAYNRAVDRVTGLSVPGLLGDVAARLPVRDGADPVPRKGGASMYVGGRWYAIDLAPVAPVEPGLAARLDVSRLQTGVLEPVLGIKDVRTDKRVSFVGGARGTKELERLVDSGRALVAFSLAPVSVDELLAVADAGEMMPPKSTWFEPKLRDGLLVHLI